MVYSVEDVCQDGEYAEKNTHCNAESFGITLEGENVLFCTKVLQSKYKGGCDYKELNTVSSVPTGEQILVNLLVHWFGLSDQFRQQHACLCD